MGSGAALGPNFTLGPGLRPRPVLEQSPRPWRSEKLWELSMSTLFDGHGIKLFDGLPATPCANVT
jgi:CxxC motif-containing protein (DUF1111 family)